MLTKGKEVVKTWKISSATSKLRRNGRIGTKIVAGLYELRVTAASTGGANKVTTTKVWVSAEHLVQRSVTVRSVVKGSDASAKAPARVVRALKLGMVTVRIRTVATVHGSAKLVFSDHGVKLTIGLADGTHTTRALTVPKAFTKVFIAHRWKKGAATLRSVHAIWQYKKLVCAAFQAEGRMSPTPAPPRSGSVRQHLRSTECSHRERHATR